ncbi:glycosyltransferase family 4 protein [Lacisediminihabitans changchengi]|uniref:Glycosyltransferase family 4 protein n=1 Tax=Lacisediminihabitans changchengi TaxID=2787634 RepID=A0A934SJJ1_9MICO|nr:glycosyltransferase family 4 protein [Lacisediminihabitans changchengi]MBK4346451.1 glycosyltransferase family 4 protein [Lacisediminihabitans changchengi]MBK4348921.1 glycosyltransferase family 4 protein [Lacisediminihabitans changchengi]
MEVLTASPHKFAFLGMGLRLSGRLRMLDPNIIVANSPKAAVVLSSIRLPKGTIRIYYMRDDLNPKRNSRLKLAVLNGFVLPRFDAFIANSEWTLSTLPAKFDSHPKRVAYPVSGSIATKRNSAPSEPLRILTLSRLDPWKGIHVLLDALHELEVAGYSGRFSLMIAGSSAHSDPRYASMLETQARLLRSPVQFLGHVDRVEALIADADCLVSVSTSPEPFGQVINQGMLGGLVVIAGDEGGPREQIDHGETGYLVTPNESAILARTIQALLEDPASRTRVAEAAQRAASRFSDRVTVPLLTEAIRSIAVEFHPIRRDRQRLCL